MSQDDTTDDVDGDEDEEQEQRRPKHAIEGGTEFVEGFREGLEDTVVEDDEDDDGEGEDETEE